MPTSDTGRPSLTSPAALVATGCGVGFLPIAPGTWGSLLALPLAGIAGAYLGIVGSAILLGAMCLLGLWAIYSLVGGQHADPGFIVVDEIVGQWLTVLFVPPDLVLFVVGFFLFRAADILKPWPASWADRKLPGAAGVMLDDLFAGLYSASALYIAYIVLYL